MTQAGGRLRHPTPAPDGAPPLTPGGRRANVSAYPSHPILKRAPWTWMIPAYFFLGGTAGAAAMIGAAAEITGNRQLARRSRLAAFAALVPCPPLLILDLGRPARFYNMLRVFRPTSPMNLGTWVLTAFGGALSTAVGSDVTGLARGLGRLGGLASGVLGPALSTYTRVLVSNTSTPAWHDARRYLPALFAAGAASSGGAAACLITPPDQAGPARQVAIVGAAAEFATARVMESRMGDAASTYSHGTAGILSRGAMALSLSGAGILTGFGRRRPAAAAGSLLLLAGACAERCAVWKAGEESALLT